MANRTENACALRRSEAVPAAGLPDRAGCVPLVQLMIPRDLLLSGPRAISVYRRLDGPVSWSEGFVASACDGTDDDACGMVFDEATGDGIWVSLGHERFVDTDDDERSYRSKLGGIPRNEKPFPPDACAVCGSQLGFVAQVDPVDVLSGGQEFVEMLFVCACASGCAIVVIPSSGLELRLRSPAGARVEAVSFVSFSY